MSEDWSSFLSDFRSLSSQLSVRLTSIPTQSHLSTQQLLLAEAQQTADDLQSLLERSQAEIRHFDYAFKARAQEQMNECRAQFQRQQQLLQSYQSKSKQHQLITSSEPLSPLSPDSLLVSSHQRSLLLDARLDVAEAGDSLDRTSRVLAETEAVGSATGQQLLQQREQFMKQRDALEATDSSLVRSRKLLKRMARRVVTNKLTSGIVILVEILLILLIGYLKYR